MALVESCYPPKSLDPAGVEPVVNPNSLVYLHRTLDELGVASIFFIFYLRKGVNLAKTQSKLWNQVTFFAYLFDSDSTEKKLFYKISLDPNCAKRKEVVLQGLPLGFDTK